MVRTVVLNTAFARLGLLLMLLAFPFTGKAQDSTATIKIRKPTAPTQRQSYYCLSAKSTDTIWRVVTLYNRSVNSNPDTLTLIFSGSRESVCIIKKVDTAYAELQTHQENHMVFWHEGFRYFLSCDFHGKSSETPRWSITDHGQTRGAIYDPGDYLVAYLRVFRKEKQFNILSNN